MEQAGRIIPGLQHNMKDEGAKHCRQDVLFSCIRTVWYWSFFWQRCLKLWAHSDQTSCLGCERVGNPALPSLPGQGQRVSTPRGMMLSQCWLLTVRRDLQMENGSMLEHPRGMHTCRCNLPVPLENELDAGLGKWEPPQNCFHGDALAYLK